ncbi:MAG: hypothetical protein GF401_18665 [Chitinivibrionales bacterium]|nr:hypothetical protein [Chitinivibrionales bacterium]
MMIKAIRLVIGLSALMLLVSCTTGSLESRGDSAYKKAQSATGDEKRRLEKEAYTYFWKAVKKKDNYASVRTSLRNRFIETTLIRGNLILSEATSTMDALGLFVQDIDSLMSPDVKPELKQKYAGFLSRLADSSEARGKVYLATEWLDKALAVASNPSKIQEQRKNLINDFVNGKLELARMQYEDARGNKEEIEEMIRAEFNAKLALYLDPENEKAQSLLSDIFRETKDTYSAYDAVIEDKPDSAIYDKVNKYDILMACPVIKQSGRGVTIKASIYNYSYNPLRLWSKNFFIENEDGKRYVARNNSKIDKEILDQEHECKDMLLYFPSPAGKVKKLVYEYKTDFGKHYSEKAFF